jgi:hypothetical protein
MRIFIYNFLHGFTMQKIIVTGFPHSGTTILKNIIGHIPDVKELVHEEKLIRDYDEDHNYAWNMCKWPFAREVFFGDEYADYTKIFILRNPLWIFSSLNKRCAQDNPPGIPPNHDVEVYIDICERYLRLLDTPCKNVHLLKYESIFDDNFAELRRTFDTIGFDYTDAIFQNEKFRNFSHRNITEIPNDPVPNVDHERYRTWQINQPIRNMNDVNKLDLLPHQVERILRSPVIMRLYPEIPLVLTLANIPYDPAIVAQAR